MSDMTDKDLDEFKKDAETTDRLNELKKWHKGISDNNPKVKYGEIAILICLGFGCINIVKDWVLQGIEHPIGAILFAICWIPIVYKIGQGILHYKHVDKINKELTEINCDYCGTKIKIGTDIKNCPNCGAPIDLYHDKDFVEAVKNETEQYNSQMKKIDNVQKQIGKLVSIVSGIMLFVVIMFVIRVLR